MSLNKKFKSVPIDPGVMRYLDQHSFGLRRSKPTEKNVDNVSEASKYGTSTFVIKLFSEELRFVASAASVASFPKEKLPEVAFIGRSNVGKSSLLNTVSGSILARVSDMPGKTKTINWYNIKNYLSLVDLPGFGFAFTNEEERAAWQKLIYHYIQNRKSLKRILLLIDSRLFFKATDYELMDLLDKRIIRLRYQIVLTKTDLVRPRDLARKHYLVLEELQKRKRALKRILFVSSKYKQGIWDLRSEIAGLVSKASKINLSSNNNNNKNKEQEKQEKQQKHPFQDQQKQRSSKPKFVSRFEKRKQSNRVNMSQKNRKTMKKFLKHNKVRGKGKSKVKSKVKRVVAKSSGQRSKKTGSVWKNKNKFL